MNPNSGDESSRELFESVYRELYRLARRHMAGQPPGHTLQATALVSEAYLRLHGHVEQLKSAEHFLRVAARAMRQVLLDHARRRRAEKRVPRERRVDVNVALDEHFLSFDAPDEGICEIEMALRRLEIVDRDLAELIELHTFGGQPIEKIAELQKISTRQGYRRLRAARAFIRRELDRQKGTLDNNDDGGASAGALVS